MATNFDDTIVALSTPIGEGGIGIVRMSGTRALEIADMIFCSKDGMHPSAYDTFTTHYGRVVDGRSNVIDEVILTVMRAPRSYTKEDVVEINCHGGILAVKKVLTCVLELGGRMASPGEFTKRAFLNGRIDLAQAEAVSDIIMAKTESALTIASSQLEGDLSKEIHAVRIELVDIASHVEAAIDFPEEDIEIVHEERLIERLEKVRDALRCLIDSADQGIVMREGILIVICGKPNVGKSSLMNVLLRRERVIVTPLPGTTRDVVEEVVNIREIPVRIMDTAGIGRPQDIIGIEGNRKAKQHIKQADIVIVMVDGSSPVTEEDLAVLSFVAAQKKRVIVAINKADLVQKADEKDIAPMIQAERIVKMSVLTKFGIEDLTQAITDIVWGGKLPLAEGAVITNARHKEALESARRCVSSSIETLVRKGGPELASVDIREAIYQVGLIIGISVSDDILDRIFEKFCIGK